MRHTKSGPCAPTAVREPLRARIAPDGLGHRSPVLVSPRSGRPAVRARLYFSGHSELNSAAEDPMSSIVAARAANVSTGTRTRLQLRYLILGGAVALLIVAYFIQPW